MFLNPLVAFLTQPNEGNQNLHNLVAAMFVSALPQETGTKVPKNSEQVTNDYETGNAHENHRWESRDILGKSPSLSFSEFSHGYYMYTWAFKTL